jgi:hypothetical protein
MENEMNFREETAQKILVATIAACITCGHMSYSLTDSKLAEVSVAQADALIKALAK